MHQSILLQTDYLTFNELQSLEVVKAGKMHIEKIEHTKPLMFKATSIDGDSIHFYNMGLEVATKIISKTVFT